MRSSLARAVLLLELDRRAELHVVQDLAERERLLLHRAHHDAVAKARAFELHLDVVDEHTPLCLEDVHPRTALDRHLRADVLVHDGWHVLAEVVEDGLRVRRLLTAKVDDGVLAQVLEVHCYAEDAEADVDGVGEARLRALDHGQTELLRAADERRRRAVLVPQRHALAVLLVGASQLLLLLDEIIPGAHPFTWCAERARAWRAVVFKFKILLVSPARKNVNGSLTIALITMTEPVIFPVTIDAAADVAARLVPARFLLPMSVILPPSRLVEPHLWWRTSPVLRLCCDFTLGFSDLRAHRRLRGGGWWASSVFTPGHRTLYRGRRSGGFIALAHTRRVLFCVFRSTWSRMITRGLSSLALLWRVCVEVVSSLGFRRDALLLLLAFVFTTRLQLGVGCDENHVVRHIIHSFVEGIDESFPRDAAEAFAALLRQGLAEIELRLRLELPDALGHGGR
mmetsp:Transcript_1312/g.3344  ORF Transcript_1312/g.3344 Transcript_1312/m.3344 type:complete len:454 (-) Transcript_1312:65-1426(-)